MKNILPNLYLILLILAFAGSCTREEDENPFQELPQKGAVAVISNTNGFFNLVDPASSSVSFDLGTKGESVMRIDISKKIKNGSVSDLKTISTFPATITISFEEALSGSGFNTTDLVPGDLVEFILNLTTETGTYSGKSVVFDISCPSALGGDYNVVSIGSSTDDCCPGQYTVETVVSLTDNGGGKYTISDWSGGLYLEWYTIYGITAENVEGDITDICNQITLTAPTQEPFGESLRGSGSRDPSTGVITFNWDNGWGDQGTMTMTPK